MKTIQMILWLTSMSFCLVFLLISAMTVISKQTAPQSASDLQQFIEPMCFLIACIGLSLTPIRAISHQIRYLLAFGSTGLIGLYYMCIVGFGEAYTNHPNSALFQMDAWVVMTLIILIAYAIALFKADHSKPANESDTDDDDPLYDPLLNITPTKPRSGSNEEIEVEIGGSPASNSAKRWRRTT